MMYESPRRPPPLLVCLSKDSKNLHLDTAEDLETFPKVGNAVVDICICGTESMLSRG